MEKTVSSPAGSALDQAALSSPFTWREGLALALVTALAAGIRLLHLSSRSLTLDEGFSVFLAQAPLSAFQQWIWRSEFNMALYYSLLRIWIHLGSSEFAVRALSVLFSAAAVPVLYLVGQRLFGRSTALVACLLFAVHPFEMSLAQQARSYSLLVLLICASSLFFLRLIERPAAWNATLYAALSAAAIYSHFFAVLVIVAQWVSLIWLRQRAPWKSLLRSASLLILLLIPLGLYLAHAQRGPVGWVPKANVRQALDVLYSLTLSKARCLVYLALWTVACWCAFRDRGERGWPYRFVAAWLLVPLTITGIAGLVQPLWVPRFLAICIPAAVLLAAAGIMQLARWSRPAGGMALLVVLIYSVSGIRFYDRHPEFSVDWRSAIEYLLPRLQPGDQLAMDPYIRYTFDYYQQQRKSPPTPLVIVNSLSSPLVRPEPRNVWTIASVLINPDDPASGAERTQKQVEAFMAKHGKTYCAQSPRPEGASVEVWQLRRCDGP